MNKTCDTCGTIWCKALDVCRTCRRGERERSGVGVEGLESRWQRAWGLVDRVSVGPGFISPLSGTPRYVRATVRQYLEVPDALDVTPVEESFTWRAGEFDGNPLPDATESRACITVPCPGFAVDPR